MNAKEWQKAINKALSGLGQTDKAYKAVIDTLSDILEQRDRTYEKYIEDGAEPVMEYTNKGGSTNTVKNPLLVLWDDLNKSALAYWRELGLTPSSYKKMTGDSPKKEKPGGLSAALKSIEAG